MIGVEIFLGYTVTEKKGLKTKERRMTFNSFKNHLEEDYEKLQSEKFHSIYLLNFFYKGKCNRANTSNEEKEERSYQDILNSCISLSEKKVRDHKESDLKTKINIWIIEARDDGIKEHKILKFY